MRSLIFFISTAALLLLAYLGYNSVMHAGLVDELGDDDARREIPLSNNAPKVVNGAF